MTPRGATTEMPEGLAAIVRRGWCSGCGVCAAACPASALAMRCAADGAPEPVGVGGCTSCGRCERVCPWGPEGPDEDVLATGLFAALDHHDAIGRCLACHAGHRVDGRESAASGGLLSWVVGRLIDDGVVDAAVMVGPDGSDALFAYRVVTTGEACDACAGSHYCPVAIDVALRDAAARQLRVVVVGLPCVIKAVRRAARLSTRVNDAVALTLALTCGQQKTRAFTAFAAQKAGVPADATLRGARYRAKRLVPPSSTFDIAFEYEGPNGRGAVRAPFPIVDWVARLFALPACDVCDDLVGETADASFMDAWLPRFTADPLGTSLVVTRGAAIEQLLARGVAEGGIVLEPVKADEVADSQRTALAYKRSGLAERLWRLERAGVPVPPKRVRAARTAHRLRALADRLAARSARSSRRIWARTHDARAVMRGTRWTRVAERVTRALDARLGGGDGR